MVPPRGVSVRSNPIQTLKDVIDMMNRTTTSKVTMRETKSSVWIDLFWTQGEIKPPWSAELYVANLMLSAFRGVLGTGWQPQEMKMLAARRPIASMSALPDCPIAWQAASISLAIGKRDMVKRLAPPQAPLARIPETSVPDLSEASAEMVRTAIEGLLCNENLKLVEIADHFGLTQRSFQRQLDRFDLKFGSILDDYRVSRAMSVLRSENISMTELSLDLGYDHPQNFARAFRRRVGQSPREFRNTMLTT